MIQASPEMLDALRSADVRYARLVSIGDYHYTDHPSGLEWEGISYDPSGELMKGAEFERTSEVSAEPLELRFTSASRAALEMVEEDDFLSSQVTYRIAILGQQGGVIGAILMYRGEVDSWSVKRGGGSIELRVEVANAWTLYALDNARYMTENSQKTRFPTDTFFDGVHGEYPDVQWGPQ